MTWSDVVDLYEVVKPIALAIISVAVYALFVFKFYRFLARRDVLKTHLSDRADGKITRLVKGLFFLLEYIIVAPLLIFFWFVVLVLLLAFLAKNRNVEQVMLLALALVGAVRLLAYYSEDLSKDLAKMLPFALLGVYLVDGAYVSIPNAIAILKSLPDFWLELAWYFGFVVLMEFVLRMISLGLPDPDESEK